jgi:hypothetical protein
LHPLLFFSRISIALGLKAEARPADLFGQIGRIEVSQQYLSRFSLIIGIADGFLDRLYQLMVGLAPSISIASGLSLSRACSSLSTPRLRKSTMLGFFAYVEPADLVLVVKQ